MFAILCGNSVAKCHGWFHPTLVELKFGSDSIVNLIFTFGQSSCQQCWSAVLQLVAPSYHRNWIPKKFKFQLLDIAIFTTSWSWWKGFLFYFLFLYFNSFLPDANVFVWNSGLFSTANDDDRCNTPDFRGHPDPHPLLRHHHRSGHGRGHFLCRYC